jgi:glycosyltransferase involved in cell wall biosynthesis
VSPSAKAGARLAIVAPGIPHPTRGASTVLFHHYVQSLRDAGFRVLNVLLLQKNNASPEALKEYEARLAEPERFEVVPCWAPEGFIRESWRRPPHLDRDALRPAEQALAEFRPDAVFALDFLCAWAAATVPARKITWLGDLNFQSYWYNSLYSWKEGTGSLREVAQVALLRHFWKRAYRQVLAPFDRVIVSSKSSEPALARLGIRSTYLPYPWPAEPLAHGVAKETVPTLLFFGGLQGLGSRSALHTIFDTLHPALAARFGRAGFRIRMSGRGALADWAMAAMKDKPEIEYLGFVEDLPELMARCHAFLAPMDVPVGNRSRILTALSHRLLVIAHPSTALGNPDLVDGQTCYLASTPEALVERIERAVARPDEAAAIVERGYQLYASKFSPERATSLMVREVEQLMEA